MFLLVTMLTANENHGAQHHLLYVSDVQDESHGDVVLMNRKG